MNDFYDAQVLLEKGEIFVNVEGRTLEEIYENVCKKMKLPQEIDAQTLKNELLEREKILSTAVGNGIAIPHPKHPLVKNESDCRVVVCLPRIPIDMQAPDKKKVFAMFILLSNSTQFHIKALSSLAKLLKDENFQKELSLKPSKSEILAFLKRM